MLESWSMKKFLAIVVLGLLWSKSINADDKKGQNQSSLDIIIDGVAGERIQKLNDRAKIRSNKKRIRRLEQELALQKIKSFCQQKYSSDKRAYNGCLCRSLDSSNIGAKCEDGWREKTKKVSKGEEVEEIENDWRRCSIYAVIKYGKKNCASKTIN